MPAEVADFIRNYLHVEALEVEQARRIILQYLASLPAGQDAKSDELCGIVKQQLQLSAPGLPEGVTKIDPDLVASKADVVAREALQTLQTTGVIVALGGEVTVKGELEFRYDIASRSGETANTKMLLPVVQVAYRLASAFLGEYSRLTSADIYLSDIDTTWLPSRAKRCLDESIDAFKHGLYLSATMNLGAASESVWIRLASLVADKYSAPTLSNVLGQPRTNISKVIDETWTALLSHGITELNSIFPVASQRISFKEHADLLRERRNYAMHNGEASSDEHTFSYEETGMLLLNATGYFNSLIALYSRFASTV